MELSVSLARILEELVHFNEEFRLRVSSSRMKKQSPLATPTRVTDTGEDYNLCGICFDKPMQVVLNCSHSFCETCVNNWQVKSLECPLCRHLSERKNSVFVLTEENELVAHRDDLLARLGTLINLLI